MKKLMLAFAVIAMSVAAQAAAIKWSTSTALYKGNATDTYAGTVYLVDSATISQTALLSAFVGGTLDITAYDVASATAAAGKITATTLNPVKMADGTEYGAGNVNYYMVAIDGDNIFISSTKSAALSTIGTTTVGFALKAQSTAAADAAAGFTSGGWYAAVPEPTSGLLMLVGLGALALRRRRA